jgi:DNA-binding transcriptional ArsR family regulator
LTLTKESAYISTVAGRHGSADGARRKRTPTAGADQAFTDTALRAIAEPRRRQILRLVRDDELTAGAIASHFDVTRPAISQHLGVLKEAGLVDERRNGTQRLYRARPQGLADLREFLDEFWGDRLSALKREAEREERRKHGKHN